MDLGSDGPGVRWSLGSDGLLPFGGLGEVGHERVPWARVAKVMFFGSVLRVALFVWARTNFPD